MLIILFLFVKRMPPQPNTPPTIPLPVEGILGADRPLVSQKLLPLYGDIDHQDDSIHLAGGISDNSK